MGLGENGKREGGGWLGFGGVGGSDGVVPLSLLVSLSTNLDNSNVPSSRSTTQTRRVFPGGQTRNTPHSAIEDKPGLPVPAWMSYLFQPRNVALGPPVGRLE